VTASSEEGTANQTINITAINDDPGNAGSLPTDIALTEDVSGNIDLSSINLADVDSGGASLTVTLTTSTGGEISAAAGTGITVGGTSTARTLTGSLTDLNNYLNTASNLTYLHGTPHTNGNNADTIQVNVNDNGNTGSGGGTDIDLGTVNVDIGAVNDAPMVNAPGSALSATEQTNLSIEGTGFSVTDADEAGSGAIATLSVGEGTLTVVVGDSGVTIDSGDGTGSVQLSGSVAQLNALLIDASSGTITYLNSSDTPSANTTITLTVNDQGNTGTDPGISGDGSSEEATANQTINITAMNDAPVLAIIGNQTVDELTELTFMASATDADMPAQNLNFTLDAISVAAGMSIDANTGSFAWIPSEAQNGVHTVTITVTDDGTLSDSETFTITVAEVNVAPIGSDTTINATEDTLYSGTLPVATDAEGDTVTYAFETDAGNGTADVNSDGSFTYTPDPNTNGPDSFTYNLSDGNGGSNTYTVDVHVAAVRDAPTVTSSAVTTATEDTAYSYTIITNDVDGNALTITAPTLPDWLTLVDNGDGTATLFGTPTNVEVGDQSVVLEISDGVLTYTQNFTLNVSGATNDPTVVDPDFGDIILLTTNTEINQNPETDDVLNPDVEVPTYEEYTENPVIEAEQAPPVEEYLTPQGSTDEDEQLVYMQDPEIEGNEEIIYLTDENDTDTRSEGRKEDRSYIYYENNLYRDIKYTAADRPISETGDDFSVLNIDSEEPIRVDVNGDYDLLRLQMDESFNTELKSHAVKARIVTVTAASFAVGFVSYLLRAGSLFASLMSSLPLWRGFDPIAIFSGDKKKKKDRKEISDTDDQKSETFFDDETE
jgi:hypothetical protein